MSLSSIVITANGEGGLDRFNFLTSGMSFLSSCSGITIPIHSADVEDLWHCDWRSAVYWIHWRVLMNVEPELTRTKKRVVEIVKTKGENLCFTLAFSLIKGAVPYLTFGFCF